MPKPTYLESIVYGNVESIYIVFDDQKKVAKTKHYSYPDQNAQILVDQAEDGAPIAVQLVKTFRTP